jgi:preflagellin peptidase FlaK
VPLADLLRLLAVPVFAWVAFRDLKTRRIDSRVWYPLLALGLITLLMDGGRMLSADPFTQRLFFVRVLFSLVLLTLFAAGFWYFGAFGLADAKAFVVLGVLFPVVPAYEIVGFTLPLVPPSHGTFSLTIITDAVLLGALYPLALLIWNGLSGRYSPAMLVGRPVDWGSVVETHGKLLQTPDGFTLSGLDLDALRMYIRWRGTTLDDLRADPDWHRDPSSLPDSFNPPTDGRIQPDGGATTDAWGAEAFLEDVGGAYGTTPETLRAGLEVLSTEDEVWVSPGMPFLLPLFFGLLVALLYGDLLFGLLLALGLA